MHEEGILNIEVNDSGAGISEDIKEQIFTKGYSTKGDNRGLGLHLVQKSCREIRWTN